MKTLSVLCLVIAAIASLLLNTLSPAPVLAAESQFNREGWAVILSPGPKHGVPWGGYHVTLTGYSNKHSCLGKDSCRKILADCGRSVHGWHLHGKLDKLSRWKGIYTQTFGSKTLDRLVTELAGKGFDKIKGPQHSGTPWHISLINDEKKSKEIVRIFKDNKVPWYLWLVPYPGDSCIERGTGCPSWKRIE